MHIRLADLRAECATNPFIPRLVKICAVTRQIARTRFEWCSDQMDGHYTRERFADLLAAFQALERTGFGRILSGSQIGRARFQWAVMPLTLDRALTEPDRQLTPGDVLPAAAKLALSLPPAHTPPRRPGWALHEVTLRPGQAAELWVPDDLTRPEAEWLGAYLQRLVQPPPQ